MGVSGGPVLAAQLAAVLAAAALMVLAGLEKHRLERRPTPRLRPRHGRLRFRH
jgi:hypothetical protein